MDTQKRNIIIICTVIAMIIVAIISVITVNTALIAKDKAKGPHNIRDNKDIDDNDNDRDQIKTDNKVCVGTYYGEYKTDDEEDESIYLKYTYILNGNNTYSANIGSYKNEGTYEIDGNKITFKHNSEDEYFIARNCSYIIIDDPDSNIYSFKLYRQ